MSRKKEEFFTDEMGRNIFIFEGEKKQIYVPQGQRRKVDVGKIYRPHRAGGRASGRTLGGSPLRFN